ncbi:MAG: rhodanese-like domain-containing protein [Pseudomonadota bacterium]
MDQLLEFTNNHLLLTGGLVASLFFLIFTEARLRARAGSDLTPADAIRLINADAQVLDIRPAEAFEKGHIAGARNLTPDQVDGNEDRLSALKDRSILITCDTGMRGSRVVADLRKKGYENIFALKGGIAAWQQDSLPLVSGKKSKKDKKKKNKS